MARPGSRDPGSSCGHLRGQLGAGHVSPRSSWTRLIDPESSQLLGTVTPVSSPAGSGQSTARLKTRPGLPGHQDETTPLSPQVSSPMAVAQAGPASTKLPPGPPSPLCLPWYKVTIDRKLYWQALIEYNYPRGIFLSPSTRVELSCESAGLPTLRKTPCQPSRVVL